MGAAVTLSRFILHLTFLIAVVILVAAGGVAVFCMVVLRDTRRERLQAGLTQLLRGAV